MRPASLLLVLLCGLLILHALHFYQPVDDAYISFRYAENLASGKGVVFNAGERVEGYTDFLWIVLLAAAQRLGAPVPLAARAMGLLLAVGTLLAAVRVARRIFPSGRGAGLPAALLLAASPGVAMWAGGGMEVPLFSFLALLSAGFWMEESGRGSWPWRWPFTACLASLARPEGVLLFAITLAWETASPGKEGSSRAGRILRPLALFLVPGAPYFLWRWIYYGAFLPNTYYAKVGTNAAVIGHGLYYLGWFLLDSGGAAIALGALLALRPRDRRISLLLWQGAAFTAYILLIGGDAYAFGRFLVPVAALLSPAAEFGFRRAWRWITTSFLPALSRAPAAGGVAMVLLAAAGTIGSFAGADYENYRMGVEAEGRRRAIGEWLRANAPSGARVALNPAGMIPYVSGLPTLDLLGLTDARIGQHGERVTNRVLFGHNRFDPEYVLSRRPDLLILGQATLLDVDPRLEDLTRPGPATFDAIEPAVARDFKGFPGDGRLWGMPGFRRLYTPAIARIGSAYFYYFALDPAAADLEGRIGRGVADAGDHARMARILMAKGEMEQARSEAARAEALDPALASLRREIEEKAAAAQRASGSRDRVLETLRRMESDLAGGDPAAAEKGLLEGLKADPDHPLLLYALGTVYERMDRSDEAMEAYRRALAARPDFADAFNNLGSLLARRGDLKQAREYWERAVAIDPNHPARRNLQKLLEQEKSTPR